MDIHHSINPKKHRIMKLQGIVGTGTGKLGASVFTIRKGVQIVRQYQGEVGNPKTESQVENRAKFKLLSQLSALAAPVVSLPRTSNALTSQRNLFIKANFPAVEIKSGKAGITASDILLTSSPLTAPAVEFTQAGGLITVAPTTTLDGWDGISAMAVGFGNDGSVRGDAGKSTDNTGVVLLSMPAGYSPSIIFYAWKYRDEDARARYGSMIGDDGDVTVPFYRLVADGDIIVSATTVANPTQA